LLLDPKDKTHATKIKSVLKVWLSTGMFRVVERQDEKHMPREFVEVGTWVDSPHL
jgi:hypothetical protein